MSLFFSRRLTNALLAFMLLFVLPACQTVTPAPTQAPGTSVTTAQLPTLATTTTAADSPVTTEAPTLISTQGDVTRNVVLGPGTFNITDTVTGLANLSGYKATLTLSFDGTQAGQPQKWSKTYVMLTTQKPAARQVTIEQSGNVTDTAQVFMAEVDGVSYQRSGDNLCIANVIVPEDSLAKRFEPAGFLTAVIGAEAAGSETVNGAAADHYKFDEHALFGQAGIAKSTGEMWVASKGGDIVKYLLTTTGSADYFGEGTEGTLAWDYELTGADQPVSIELPPDCPAGMVDAPLLPDATNVESTPGDLTYDTSTSLADAAAFYQKQIPALGWQVNGDPVITDTLVQLGFTQPVNKTNAITMTVMATSDQGVTSVDIELAR